MANVEKYNNNGGTLFGKVICLQLTLYVGRKMIVISKLQKFCVLQGTLQMSLSLRRYLPPPIEWCTWVKQIRLQDTMKHLFVCLSCASTKANQNTLECCKPAKKQYIVPAENNILECECTKENWCFVLKFVLEKNAKKRVV